MIITPVSVSAVTHAVEKALLLDERLKPVTVTRSEEINALPGQCPWVGIYRARCDFPSRTLGVAAGFRGQRVQVMLLLQETDPLSGAACEDRLNELVDKAISVLLTDTTLDGAVHAIDEFSVQYPDYRRVDDSAYMQTAMVTFTAITMVGGS